MKKRSTYDPQLLSKKMNISIEEAIIIIQERKRRSSGSLESYISRHGEELGKQKYDEFRNKCKNTLQKYIEKYGEELGKQKYDEYLKTKNSRSKEFYKNKFGDGWEEKFESDMKSWKYKLTEEYFIEKHGEELGKEKYKEMITSKSHTLEKFIAKYGDELGREKYKEYSLKRDSMSLEFHIEKYGDELGRIKYEDRIKRSSFAYVYFVQKYGKEYAEEKYEEYKKNPSRIKEIPFYVKSKNSVRTKGPCSKSANRFFTQLQEKLGRDLLFGSKSKELKLYDDVSNKFYFYDCLDERTKTIIEFNGLLFHYHESFGDNWIGAFGLTKEESIKKDTEKRLLAESNGYKLLYVLESEVSGKKRTHNMVEYFARLINENES